MALLAIKYDKGSLKLLDQRLLPFESAWLDVPTAEAAWQHIKDMVVRGAPAIGVTGALAMAVHIISGGNGSQYASAQAAVEDVAKTMDYLVTSRPTAVNLADSATKLKAAASAAAAAPSATGVTVAAAVVAAAEATLAGDVAANKAIGAAGAAALLAAARSARPGGRVRVLTHCNTGSLATAAYGTALGVLRALHEQGKLEHAYCTETRPYNQGARLTAYELVHDGLPSTLVCDSAAAALMAAGDVDAVVVGADRVVANGDTANKIGTFALALAAKHHALPFFVAAPTSTLDAARATGAEIEIEQRPPEEITHFRGARVAAENIGIWNPCFDVTPGALITGIVTERGVVARDAAAAGGGGVHRVREFMTAQGLWKAPAAAANGDANGTTAVASHPDALSPDGVASYVRSHPELRARVGAEPWSVREVGDGNLNFVYIVTGSGGGGGDDDARNGGVVVKQALPFVRCIGEAWPLSTDRARIEADALRAQRAACAAHVPELFRYERAASAIAMQYLGPPFTVVRHAVIAGAKFPLLARHVGDFLAATLFSTSALALGAAAFREQTAAYINPDLCDLTLKVVFTEPYCAATNNRWTAPQLDADAAALRADAPAKAAATALKDLFMGKAEALLHGDLHTGSLMATQEQTYVIDPEFAFVGPAAFDVGKIAGELLISFFASDGLESGDGGGAPTSSRAAQRAWLLSAVGDVWERFAARYLELWTAHVNGGDGGVNEETSLTPPALAGPGAAAAAASLAAVQAGRVAQLARESVGFAGAAIVRRIVGIAHTADMDSIADADVRAACERRALRFGRHLLVEGADEYFAAGGGGWRLVAEAAAAARAADGLPA